jgi:hypothetical protein
MPLPTTSPSAHNGSVRREGPVGLTLTYVSIRVLRMAALLGRGDGHTTRNRLKDLAGGDVEVGMELFEIQEKTL